MNLTFQEFIKSAKPGKRVPLVKSLASRTLSPVAMVEALGLEQTQFALLESGKGGEKLASHTFICYAPSLVYRTKGLEVTVNAEPVTGVHPYGYLEELLQQCPAEKIEGLPKFAGGAVGFISYDMARFFEKLPEMAEDDLQIPDLYFLLCERTIVIDNYLGSVSGVINLPITDNMDLADAYHWAEQEFEKLQATFSTLEPDMDTAVPKLALENLFEPEANMSKARFEEMVVRAKEYIEAGDVFQVNLSIRLGKELKSSPWQVYRL